MVRGVRTPLPTVDRRPSLQFEEGIEKTVCWYLDNQVWMDNITSGEYEKYYSEMYSGKTIYKGLRRCQVVKLRAKSTAYCKVI